MRWQGHLGGSARKKRERNKVHAYMHQVRRRLGLSLCRALTHDNGSRSGVSLPAGRRPPTVRPSDHPLLVELRRVNTPVFCGEVQGIEIRAETGAIIEMTGRFPQYLTIGQTGCLVLRIGKRERRFRLKNSSLSLDHSRCVILAEEVREISAAIFADEFAI